MKHRGQVVKEHPIERKTLPPRPTDGHRVDVELGFTENLGDMNFGKLAVRVTIPCTAEDIREAGEAAFTHADSMLEEFSERFIPKAS